MTGGSIGPPAEKKGMRPLKNTFPDKFLSVPLRSLAGDKGVTGIGASQTSLSARLAVIMVVLVTLLSAHPANVLANL